MEREISKERIGMKQLVKVFVNDEGKRAGVTLPAYAHETDAGLDLQSRIEICVWPGDRKLVPTGLHVAISEGYAGFVQPRSGLALKNGITFPNSPGLIDSPYRGEVGVIVQNTGNEKFFIVPGDKIAQLVIQKVENVRLLEVGSLEELGETDRGEGGYGSTGI